MRADHAVAPPRKGTDRGAPRPLRRLSGVLPTAPAALAKRSFAPIVDRDARILVLGTLPGEESLRRGEYYAHPRNLFWPILFALFEARPAPTYADKLRFLAARGIALWDVVEAAERIASADSAIRAERPNAIDALLDTYGDIRAIAFNGTTAQRLHDRHLVRRQGLDYLALPSTSPAHARLGFAEKLARWTVLRETILAP